MNSTDDELLIWRAGREPSSCRLTQLEGFDDTYLLREPESLAATWPIDVRYRMDPSSPKNMRLCDNVRVIDPIIVASERLAAFLGERLQDQIECLPVAIVNHKKRVEPDRYFIVRPVGCVDALNLERSKVTWSKMLPDSVEFVKRLVVDPARVPAASQLFRLKHYMGPLLVRRELAAALDAEGFTNLAWQALRDHESL
jgi:hypothetical protein